jgi:hypothetical protein
MMTNLKNQCYYRSMTNISPVELESIMMAAAPLEHGGCLDEVEAALRAKNQTQLADALLKLQQDAGLEMDPSFNPDDRSNPPGPRAAALWDAYMPLTHERFGTTLNQIHTVLAEGDVKMAFAKFMADLKVPLSYTPALPPPPAP